MKTLKSIFLGVALSGAMISLAQNGNNLIVFSETGDKFYLVLNGLKYNQKPETNVRVTNLPAPNYKAVILFENGQPQLNANVYLMWEGNNVTNKEFTYGIVKKDDKYKLKFVSQADLGGQAPPNPYAANCVSYNPNGTLLNVNVGGPNAGYNSTTVTTTEVSTTLPNNNVGVNVNGMGVNVNVNGMGMNGTTTVTSYTTTTTTSSGYSENNYSQNAPPPQHHNECYPMNENNFRDLMNSVKGQSFEDSKLKVAQQAIAANCVRTDQVKQLMGLFSFEDSKLTLAKSSYDRTVDKNNYFKLNDAFTYSSSVDDLNNFISNH